MGRGVFLEGSATPSEGGKEQEADAFAADLLIPGSQYTPIFVARIRRPLSAGAVSAFGDAIGIAPGIVVGRPAGMIAWWPFSHLNQLKMRYNWVERS